MFGAAQVGDHMGIWASRIFPPQIHVLSTMVVGRKAKTMHVEGTSTIIVHFLTVAGASKE